MAQDIIIRVTAAHLAEEARLQDALEYDPSRHNAAALALNEHLRNTGAQGEGEARARVHAHNTCDTDECGCLGLSTISIDVYWVPAPAIVHRHIGTGDGEPFEFALLNHWRWSRYVADEDVRRDALSRPKSVRGG